MKIQQSPRTLDLHQASSSVRRDHIGSPAEIPPTPRFRDHPSQLVVGPSGAYRGRRRGGPIPAPPGAIRAGTSAPSWRWSTTPSRRGRRGNDAAAAYVEAKFPGRHGSLGVARDESILTHRSRPSSRRPTAHRVTEDRTIHSHDGSTRLRGSTPRSTPSRRRSAPASRGTTSAAARACRVCSKAKGSQWARPPTSTGRSTSIPSGCRPTSAGARRSALRPPRRPSGLAGPLPSARQSGPRSASSCRTRSSASSCTGQGALLCTSRIVVRPSRGSTPSTTRPPR